MVQRTGFEPAKHYALGPHPSPFDHSGTSAWGLSGCLAYFRMTNAFQSTEFDDLVTIFRSEF